MNVKDILISQPAPTASSPYIDFEAKYGVSISFHPFFKAQSVDVREFRAQRVNVLDFTAIVFTSKLAIDSFFELCKETRVVVPETMKYFCQSEAIALYLQKYIVYRKRKIFFGNGTIDSIVESVGAKHKGENFLITCTDNTKTDLNKLFTKAKLKHSQAVFVKTVNSDLSSLDLSKYQMIVFYSPSDVRSLKENFPDFVQKDTMFVSFGPATAKALKKEKFKVEIEAPTPEAPSIAKALMLYFEKK